MAAFRGEFTQAKVLMKYVTDLGLAIADFSEQTALHVAARQGHAEILEELLIRLQLVSSPAGASEVDLRMKDTNIGTGTKDLAGWCPLHCAIIGGHANAVDVLLRFGADPNAETEKRRNSCLHLAATVRHAGIIKALIKAGADPLHTNDMGRLPQEFPPEEEDHLRAILKGFITTLTLTLTLVLSLTHVTRFHHYGYVH